MKKEKKKKDYCSQCQGHCEGSKCQRLSSWYLLNHQTFSYQTWYCDASSWARVSCKKIGLLFLRSRWQQWFIWSKYVSLYYIFWAADPFACRLSLIVHYFSHWEIGFLCWLMIGVFYVKIRLLFARSRSQWRLKTLLNLYVSYIFCTIDFLATKLGVLIYY